MNYPAHINFFPYLIERQCSCQVFKKKKTMNYGPKANLGGSCNKYTMNNKQILTEQANKK